MIWNCFQKNQDQIDSFVNIGRIFSVVIKMEFRLPKWWALIMKRGKKVKSEGISMFDGKKIKNIEQDEYTYLWILEVDGANHEEIKYQMKKEYIRRRRIY